MIGSTIAHYRITAKLGEGGMGEVYRATDDRLNRDVAIKLLPASVEQDPARLARFKREAQTLASLSHGNIAQVFGLEEQDGKHAIVLELVDGEDLSERIKRGPLSLEDTRDIALQIAEALEAAHAKGIVHRDLKPANIKLAPDGTVKVLDFGLAKALAGDDHAADISNSPTMTAAATMAGIILGTASYMAPEQAKGKPVDRRADVWAFGVVVYEMLCGRRPFEGDGVSEVLAHVITQEPDLEALPTGLPSMLTELLERCLRKDPRQRVPDIAVARITLQELDEDAAATPGVPPTVPPRGILLAWWLPGTIGLLLGLALAWGVLSGGSASPAAATHFDLIPDPGISPEVFALSSDGSFLVYGGVADGEYRLFVRRLDGHTSEAIPGTEGGKYPFLSPDDQQVGFLAAGRLYRVSLTGGPPKPIAPVAGRLTGAVWTPDDTLFISTSASKVLHRVEAAGGEAIPLEIQGLTPDMYLQLPRATQRDGTLLVTLKGDSEADARIALLEVDSGEWRALLPGSDARLAAPDRLLFVQQRAVMTVGFDPNTLEIVGDARPAGLHAPCVFLLEGLPRFHVEFDDRGSTVYLSGSYSESDDILQVSADGIAEATGLKGTGPQADSSGRRALAMQINNTVHLLDLQEGTDTPLTFSNTSSYPLWTPDESQVIFSDRREGAFSTWVTATDGSSVSEPYYSLPLVSPITTTVMPDGTTMGYEVDPVTARDVWIRRPGQEVEQILATPANERAPSLAPGGRYFAYVSDEEGADRIYLRDLEALDRFWRVGDEGGLSPIWSRDGSELYYLLGNSILAVPIRTTEGVRVGESRVVFSHDRLERDDWGNRAFDTLPDGGLLVSVRVEADVVLRVVLAGSD